MLETSVLPPTLLPDSFTCFVRGRIDLASVTVERHDYRFSRPQQSLFQSPYGFLDLALSPRPGAARGRYIDAPGDDSRPLGDVIFIPADHGLNSEWGAGAQSSICCRFGATLADDRDGWSMAELAASLDVRSPFVRDVLIRLAREIEAPGFGSELMAEALCTQLSIELGRYFRGLGDVGDEVSGRLSPAQLRHIEERLDAQGKAPSIAELALECGLSTRHFFRMFRATTGRTLMESAAERRVVRAKALLAARAPAIKEIAWRCGFETAAAFSAAFRRTTGVSPREYRQQMLH
jgi:AraC family transcriptional regulator